MKFDYSKLRGRIIEKFGSYEAFNKAAGWHEYKVNRILNNSHKLFTGDMETLMDMLEIEPTDIKVYFFNKKV